MEAAVKAKDPLLKSSDIPVLFSHLPELLNLSRKFLKLLERGPRNKGRFVQTFAKIQDDMAVFVRYAVHYQCHFKTIRRTCNSNSLFLSLDQVIC